MDIKLIAFDLDGTTLDEQGGFPANNKKAIERAAQAGITMVPCTGRCYHEIPEDLLNMPQLHYYITSNGAMLYHNTQVEASHCLAPNLAVLITQKLLELDSLPELYVEGRAYSYYTPDTLAAVLEKYRIPPAYAHEFTRTRHPISNPVAFVEEHRTKVEKVHAFLLHRQNYSKLVASLGETAQLLEITSSGSSNIELTQKGVSKGATLMALCQKLAIPPAQVAVAGDNYNDLSMFEFAALGYAPENSTAAIKKIASDVVCSCNQGALAEAVQNIMDMAT